MKHCGMDVHQRSITVEILDATTGEVAQRTLKTERGALTSWLSREERMRVVMEAGSSSHWVAELIEELGHEVVVVDPNRTKAVAVSGGYKKTDAIDAAMLAWLSSKGALWPSHRPSAATRQVRRELRLRQRLVRSRGDLVRAVRSALAAEGVLVRGRRTRGFPEGVRGLEDPVTQTPALQAVLRAIDVLEEEIQQANDRLHKEAEADEVVRRLMTVPGVGPVAATAFRAVIENPRRFGSGRQVAAYLGLVPRVYSSGTSERRGRISKHGDGMMRALLTESAHVLLSVCRRPSDLQAWGRQLAARIGRRKAVVAVARKLAVLMWSIWKRETTFRPSLPSAEAA